MNLLSTVSVVPSAIISKNEAHSPQLKPSASRDNSYSGFVFFDVASRAMRALASWSTVIIGVVKYEAVSAQTVSLKGFGSAKYSSERLFNSQKLARAKILITNSKVHLRLISCSKIPWRPRSARSKLFAPG